MSIQLYRFVGVSSVALGSLAVMYKNWWSFGVLELTGPHKYLPFLDLRPWPVIVKSLQTGVSPPAKYYDNETPIRFLFKNDNQEYSDKTRYPYRWDPPPPPNDEEKNKNKSH